MQHNSALAVLPASLGKLGRLRTIMADACAIVAVPAEVLQGCGALQTLSLHGNPITFADVAATPGYQQFEQRRAAKFTKAIMGGVLLGSAGLDEGVDRPLMNPAKR